MQLMEAIIHVRFIVLLGAACAVSACAPSRNFNPETASAAAVAEQLPQPTIADTRARLHELRIGPNDKLTVSVFGVPDLTTTGAVDSAGEFRLPLIGSVPAAGQTPSELAQAITLRMSRYVKRPQVNVVIDEAVSRQITVDGSVTRPGMYQITGETSLLRAVAIAGGLSNDALRREVLIFRTVDGQRMVARYNIHDIRGARAPDPTVYGNDVIVVASNTNRALFLDLMQATPLLNLFYLLR